MTPTTRSAGVLAGVAVCGLFLPIWVAVAGMLLVLAATLVDGLSVREAPRIVRHLDSVLSRGVPVVLAVDAEPPDARGVLLRQPAIPGVEVRTQAGRRELRGEVVPLRRGRQLLPAVAGASLGPLGLARWHHPEGEGIELQVYPNLVLARALALRLRQGHAAPDGRLRRGPLGLGTDFESIREYSADDDIRQVNWRASARLGRPMSNQYRVEQDHDVLCLIDCGRLMCAPIAQG